MSDPEVTEQYTIQLRNRFAALSDSVDDVEELWNEIKHTMKDAALKSAGTIKARRKEPWLSKEADFILS